MLNIYTFHCVASVWLVGNGSHHTLTLLHSYKSTLIPTNYTTIKMNRLGLFFNPSLRCGSEFIPKMHVHYLLNSCFNLRTGIIPLYTSMFKLQNNTLIIMYHNVNSTTSKLIKSQQEILLLCNKELCAVRF